MPSARTRAAGLAAAPSAVLALLLCAAPAPAAFPAPDPVVACHGTPSNTTTDGEGRVVARCLDGRTRDWQRVSVEDAEAARPGSLTFTIRRPEAGMPVAVGYATADGTATAGTHYAATSGTLVLEADELSRTVTVPTTAPVSAGEDLTVRLSLSDPQGWDLEPTRATAVGTLRNEQLDRRVDGEIACGGSIYDIVIVDRLPAIRCLVLVDGRTGAALPTHQAFSVADVHADPRAGSVTFAVARAAGGSRGWVRYETVDGTARAGVDYVATSGTAFLSGDKRIARVRVPLLDGGGAGDRAFTLRLSTAEPAVPIAREEHGTATIRRAGPLAPPAVSRVLDAAPSLGGAPTAWSWARCDAAGACTTIAGADGATYRPTSADLGVRLVARATEPGPDGAPIRVATPASAPVAYAAPDPVAACDGTAYTTGTLDGREVVRCSDGRTRGWQRVRIEDARVDRNAAGGARLSFRVSRPEAGNPLRVEYATANGTAVAGTDFTAASGALLLEANETSATIEVPVTALARRGSDLALAVALSDPSGVAAFDRGRATGVVENRWFNPDPGSRPDADWLCDGDFFSLPQRADGDWALTCLTRSGHPWTTVAVGSPSVDARAGVATFELARPDDPHASIFVAYETVDGTARAGVDYTATSGVVPIRWGSTRAYVPVPVNPDALASGERTFALRLSTSRPGASITSVGDGVATIRHVTGTPRVGVPLAAPLGASDWQWERCDAQDACETIPGATSASYAPSAADAGQTLRVRTATAMGDGTTARDAYEAAGRVRAATPATPAVLAAPEAVTEARAATFALSGKEDDAAYECSLDGGAWTACADGAGAEATFTGLASGPHRLAVRQRTVDGRTSAAVTRGWAVAAAPDGAAACDGGPFTTTTVLGRPAVACDDGATRDWQRVTVADAEVRRSTTGATTLRFRLARRAAGAPLAVSAATEDGTASAGTHYAARSETVVFEADRTTATVDVTVPTAVGSGRDEDRTLRLRLGDPEGQGADAERGTAVGTIHAAAVRTPAADGDEACDGGFFSLIDDAELGKGVLCLGATVYPYARIEARPVAVDAAAGIATVELTRAVAGAPLAVTWETQDGTARAGADYTAASGRAVFGGPQRIARVHVPIAADAAASGGRSFAVRLAPSFPNRPANFDLPGQVEVTIRHPAGGLPAVTRAGRAFDASALAPDATAWAWERCDARGACRAIPGAAAATYEPAAADVGRRLRARPAVPGPDGTAIGLTATTAEPVRAAAAPPALAGGPAEGAETTETGATFALSGKEDDAAYECSLDGAPFAACGAAPAFDGLAPGPHELRVRQRTADGAASPLATRRWTVVARAVEPDPREPDPREPNPRQPDPREPDPRRPDPTDPDPRQPDPGRPDPTVDPGPRTGGDPPPAPAPLRVTGRRQQARMVTRALAGETNVVLRCSAACALRTALRVDARTARRLGLRSTRVGVADGRLDAGPGLVRLRVRFGRAAARELARIGRRVTVAATLRDPAGGTVAVRFVLKPAARR